MPQTTNSLTVSDVVMYKLSLLGGSNINWNN